MAVNSQSSQLAKVIDKILMDPNLGYMCMVTFQYKKCDGGYSIDSSGHDYDDILVKPSVDHKHMVVNRYITTISENVVLKA